MSEWWQNAIVFLLVAAATGYLLRTCWRWWTRKAITGCGTCHGCGSSKSPAGPLVTLETPDNKRSS